MELRRVVVTGLGALTPIGNNVQEYWTGLINGVSGAAPITYYDPSKFRTHFACEVKNFNVEDFIDRKEARKMDRIFFNKVLKCDFVLPVSFKASPKSTAVAASSCWLKKLTKQQIVSNSITSAKSNERLSRSIRFHNNLSLVIGRTHLTISI